MSAQDRLERLQLRIESACRAAGRSPEEVCLIAVSKSQSAESIRELYELGIRNFGESRLQEALPKIEALPKDIVWHFVGALQSNKARKVSDHFAVIHSLDSFRSLASLGRSLSRLTDVLIQVNIASEPQKSGVLPDQLDALFQSVLQCPQVRFRGLMTIGPANPNAEAMRPYFRELRRRGDIVGAEWLSMGMSNDFDVAIQEGATHIRVGSALFGGRS